MAAPYTVADKVRNLVSRSSVSRSGTGAVIGDPQINEAIDSAQQRIDSNLGAVYTVPFNPVLPLITDIATAIAAFEVDLTFRETRDYNSELNPVMLRYREMMKELEKLRTGQSVLPGYTPGETPPDNPNDGGSIVSVENQPQIWPGSCGDDYWGRYYGWTL